MCHLSETIVTPCKGVSSLGDRDAQYPLTWRPKSTPFYITPDKNYVFEGLCDIYICLHYPFSTTPIYRYVQRILKSSSTANAAYIWCLLGECRPSLHSDSRSMEGETAWPISSRGKKSFHGQQPAEWRTPAIFVRSVATGIWCCSAELSGGAPHGISTSPWGRFSREGESS